MRIEGERVLGPGEGGGLGVLVPDVDREFDVVFAFVAVGVQSLSGMISSGSGYEPSLKDGLGPSAFLRNPRVYMKLLA